MSFLTFYKLIVFPTREFDTSKNDEFPICLMNSSFFFAKNVKERGVLKEVEKYIVVLIVYIKESGFRVETSFL